MYNKSGHIHASQDIPIKGPLASKSGERWAMWIRWPVVYKVGSH